MDKRFDNATRQRVDDPCQVTRDLTLLSSPRQKKTARAPMQDIWRSTARHLGLVSLPVEILAQAFEYLDFPGVLAVKLVRYIPLYIYVTCSFLALWRHVRRFIQRQKLGSSGTTASICSQKRTTYVHRKTNSITTL